MSAKHIVSHQVIVQLRTPNTRDTERHDAGIPSRRIIGNQIDPLITYLTKQKAAIFDEQSFDPLHSDFQEKGETRVEGVDANHVRPSAFETAGAFCNRPFPDIEVAGVLDHMPSVFGEAQTVACFRAAVKYCEAFWPE